VVGDMADTWIYGPMSDPAGAKIARNIRPVIPATELLGTELEAWKVPVPDLRPSIAKAYERSLLYGEHTWGGAFTWMYGRYLLKFGTDWDQDRASGKFQKIESSWDEHSSYIQRVQSLIAPANQTVMSLLAQAVNVSGRKVAVFNGLPWSRAGVVSVPFSGDPVTVVDVQTGAKINSARQHDGTIAFVAPAVPAGGYRTFSLVSEANYVPVPPPSIGADNVLETPFFKATLVPENGAIKSLIDKRSGRELVDVAAPQGFGQYLYESFDRDQVRAFVQAYVKIDAEWGTNELGKPSLPSAAQVPYRSASPNVFQSRYERTPISVSAVMEAPAAAGSPNAVTTRVTLYQDMPWLDLEVTVHDKPFTSWPEAGWICLPFKLDSPAFRLGRLGGFVNPAQDIVAGCNFHQFALNGGLTITDAGGQGIGLCALDSPLVSLGEPGCWKYSKAFSPRQSRVYVNLFNNQWSTNFRLWNAGTWTSRVRIWAVNDSDAERSLITPAAEARLPLLAAIADSPPGKLQAAQAGLQLSQRGIKVTAFGPNPDGDGLILRLWEEAGHSGLCTIRLPGGMNPRFVQPADLRGRPKGNPIPVKGGAFEAPILPFTPASFILSDSKPAAR